MSLCNVGSNNLAPKGSFLGHCKLCPSSSVLVLSLDVGALCDSQLFKHKVMKTTFTSSEGQSLGGVQKTNQKTIRSLFCMQAPLPSSYH